MPKPFLHRVAEEILEHHPEDLGQICIVLPSRRAGLFLKRAFAKKLDSPTLAPVFIGIESLTEELSGLSPMGKLDSLFSLYSAYRSVFGAEAEAFESFIKWAGRLIQDFNEIDRYAIDAKALYTNLTDIKRIESWGVEAETPELMENFLQFWRKLHPIYLAFRKELEDHSLGYQGMMYRKAADKGFEGLRAYLEKRQLKKFYFVGFNALNTCEERLIQDALNGGLGHIYFDADETYLDDEHHEAGMFLRRYRKWPYFQKETFGLVSNHLRQEKRDVFIEGVPKQIAMAKAVGHLLRSTSPSDDLPEQKAVVLADETLLLPTLNSIPPELDDINVTMGLNLRELPLPNAIEVILEAHERAHRLMQDGKRSFQIYHKDLERLLLHPFFASAMMPNQATEILGHMRVYNAPFLSHKKLAEWMGESTLVSLLENQTPAALLKGLIAALATYHDKDSTPVEDIESAVLLHRTLIRLIDLYAEYDVEPDFTTTLSLFRQLLREDALEFYGEPLSGLQIMGVLETRLLDFEHVIMTSVNEDILPAGRSDNSFIPYDLKRAFGLPTHREKDAVYAYHFYRLLQGASQVHLFYNTESDRMSGGEASRFIEQLRLDFIGSQTKIHEHTRFAQVRGEQLLQPFQLERGPFMAEALKNLAERGISPTHLQWWVNDPPTFYKKVLLRMEEADEVEESMAANTMGNVVHGVLEDFYKPFIGSCPQAVDFDILLKSLEERIALKYQEQNKRPLDEVGKNNLIGHVLVHMTRLFIREEAKREADYRARGVEWIIRGTERRMETTIDVAGIPYPVKLKGFADRIDTIDGLWHVIDYKTGKVEPGELSIKEWEEIITPEGKTKALQLIMYAWLLSKEEANLTELKAGIHALRKVSSGLMLYKRQNESSIYLDDLQTFESILTSLLQEIFQMEGLIAPRELTLKDDEHE